jgi:hypothetical protein
MATERTFGYHATEPPRIFEIDRDAGEMLPAGWVDTPAKLAPASVETDAADPQAHVAAPAAGKESDAARIDQLAAELAALRDIVKTLQRPAPKPRRRRRKRKIVRRERQGASSAGQPTPVEI